MKNREIYLSALRLLAQDADPQENQDYEERAPYLLASLYSELFDLDSRLRSFLGADIKERIDKACFFLDEDFPLLDRFVAVAARYLAAMLVLDEDGELSDKLFDMYCKGLLIIQNEIPATVEKIINKYK